MQTKPKPIIYSNLTRTNPLAQKLLFVRQDNKTFGQAVFPQFKVFSIIRKANEKRKHTKYNHKSGTKRTNSDYSFANFL